MPGVTNGLRSSAIKYARINSEFTRYNTMNNLHEPITILTETIDIPDSAYERAEIRYRDIGEWLCRSESLCREYDPIIFPQGSFLLGTVTRPPDANGEYDIDLAVKLQRGVSKSSHTQKELKVLIGIELEAYRKARQIEQLLDEKRRCWRLLYKDHMSFHIDALPCIPEDEQRRSIIKEAVIAHLSDEALAKEVARLTVSITDNERSDYQTLCYNWNVSNPQGYGRWFASRVRLAGRAIQSRLLMEGRATIEDIPTYKFKAPLQRCIQLLKIHRDIMFKNDQDRQPISIIITTLAARAYQGEEDVTEALLHIVDKMAFYIQTGIPRVPNPVNPEEDFSDKWDTPEGRKLDLEGNFHSWLIQAQSDLHRLAETRDVDDLIKRVEESLGLSLNRKVLLERLGGSAVPPSVPAVIASTQRIKHPHRPWASE